MTFQENLLAAQEKGYFLVWNGHSHQQLYYYYDTNILSFAKGQRTEFSAVEPSQIKLVNPGSVGQPRDKDARIAFSVWNKTQNTIQHIRVAYNVELTIDKISKHNLPVRNALRLRDGT
jgi:diadenosine tetraphosphatase ApaH/serine/threonine PP2A family protein phosphatase